MARSTFKVLFYMNGNKEKNDIVCIIGRVTTNRAVTQFNYKQSIPKTLWDVKGDRAKGKSAGVHDINLALDNIKVQITKHCLHVSDREALVTAEMASNAYQGIGSEYETLLKASGRENEIFKKRVGRDRVMAITAYGWRQETMWRRSSSLFTDGRICPCRRLNPTSSRGL